MSRRDMIGAALAAGLMLGVAAEAQDRPVPQPGRPAMRQGGGGPPAGMGQAEDAPLLFEEKWTTAPLAQPMRQDNLGNSNLTLHLYGDIAGIRKSNHPTEDYTYTGETRTNWAITVGDKAGSWDLSRNGKIMLRTRNSGFKTTHIVIRTGDGRYFVSEEGSPDSSAWITRDYILQDLNWRALLMEDKPTNASNQRQPDPKLTPVVAQARATPDLTKVTEIGFSDLSPGGWIPSTSRIKAWAVYGRRSEAG